MADIVSADEPTNHNSPERLDDDIMADIEHVSADKPNSPGGPELSAWERASDIRSITPFIWTDADGIEVALQPILHMPFELPQVYFYGPVTEWKETIDGKYIWVPTAFDKATPDEEESMEGHFNNEGTNMYPKLITALNKSDITLEKINQTMRDKNLFPDGSSDIKIFREGKYLYFQHEEEKRKVLVHLWGPVITIAITFLFLKTEGKLLESFTIKRHDIPMDTLGMSAYDAEKYYEAIEKNPSLTVKEWRDTQHNTQHVENTIDVNPNPNQGG